MHSTGQRRDETTKTVMRDVRAGTGGRRTLPAALAALLAAATVALVACGGGSDAGSQDGITTGVAKCTHAELNQAVKSWGEAEKEKAALSGRPGAWRCADGWAVTFPEIGPPDQQYTATLVFEAEGQFWIPKDRTKICGETAAKSEVPKPLFRLACQTN